MNADRDIIDEVAAAIRRTERPTGDLYITLRDRGRSGAAPLDPVCVLAAVFGVQQ